MKKTYKNIDKCNNNYYNKFVNKGGVKMETKARNIGNSLGVIIPNYMAKVLEIEKGTELEIKLKNKKIEITKEVK